MIPMVRRIAFAWLFLAATAALLAGCGKSSRASTGTANTHVTAQDITYADAINLRAADVPGLVGAKLTRQRPTRSGPFGTEMETCDGGVVGAGAVIGISSQRFRRSNERHGHVLSFSDTLLPIESVHSAVYILRSAALAFQDFTAANSARARACLKHLILSEDATTRREGASHSEPLFAQVEASSLPSPLRGVSGYGLRITAALAIEAPGTEGRSKYYEDSFGFVIGRTVITLNTTGDPQPFPSASERRLLSLLYCRAEAHKL
jgi:hypothetical protein